MSFLRSVRQQSTLAGRYVALLERVWSHPTANADPTPLHETGGVAPSDGLVAGATLFGEEHNGSYTTWEHVPESYGLQKGDNLVISMFPDPNDFLFGMGLPQEVLTTNWPSADIFR